LVKVVGHKGQYRITIPKELAEEKNWEPGTVLRFLEAPDGTIILKEVVNEKKKSKKD
jgi:AbrB family looped-hinge helix DNA binding protein